MLLKRPLTNGYIQYPSGIVVTIGGLYSHLCHHFVHHLHIIVLLVDILLDSGDACSVDIVIALLPAVSDPDASHASNVSTKCSFKLILGQSTHVMLFHSLSTIFKRAVDCMARIALMIIRGIV